MPRQSIKKQDLGEHPHPSELSKDNGSWVLPQALAVVASQIKLVKVNGLYSFSESLLATKEAAAEGVLSYPNGRPLSKDALGNIISHLATAPRSSILPTKWRQTDTNGIRYASPVPLVLSAIKEYRDIPYMSWNWSELLDPVTAPRVLWLTGPEYVEVAQLMLSDWTNPFSVADLLAIRAEARKIKSGSQAGGLRPLGQVIKPYNCTNSEFTKLPKLLQVQLIQTWVYQPSLRTKFMFGTPENLDEFYSPLIDTEILQTGVW